MQIISKNNFTLIIVYPDLIIYHIEDFKFFKINLNRAFSVKIFINIQPK